MPTQHGPIKLQGTLGDITFYKNDDGTFGAKTKTSISKERMATDPKFIRTRENGAEFGRAGKGGKLIREAFQTRLKGADRLSTARLLRVLMRIIKTDTTSIRGEKKLSLGNLAFLQDFDFNILGKLNTTFKVTEAVTITRTTGVVDIDIPAYVPEVSVIAPTGATHYKLIAAASEFDFDANTALPQTTESGFLPVNNTATTPLTLSMTLTPNTALSILTVLGIQFYQDSNGIKYALNNSDSDALCIVNVAP